MTPPLFFRRFPPSFPLQRGFILLDQSSAPAIPVLSENPSSPKTQTPPAHFENPTFLHRLPYAIAIILPFAGLIAGIVSLWGHGFNWTYGGILIGTYLFSALGVTVGYHRLFCHRAWETSGFVRFLFGVMGSTAAEGSILKWVSTHRCHHQHSDGDADPHSPHHFGAGGWNLLRGLWHAHIGWMFRGDPVNLGRYVTDLVQDRVVKAVSKSWGVWAILGLIVPAVIAGLITWSWTGALLGFLWGGLARVFLIHHVTWSINSICHLWGSKPFRSHDESRNNLLFGYIGLGEGWHNNHHAFPTSARHGLRWWELDLSYAVIRGMQLLGLAWNVRVPSKMRMQAQLQS